MYCLEKSIHEHWVAEIASPGVLERKPEILVFGRSNIPVVNLNKCNKKRLTDKEVEEIFQKEKEKEEKIEQSTIDTGYLGAL